MARQGQGNAVNDEIVEDDSLLFMKPREEYDACILGVAERFEKGGHHSFVVYDRACVIKNLMVDMDEEDAEEFFEFNIAGAYVGPATPAYLEPLIEDEP
jgi:hypothetical protein